MNFNDYIKTYEDLSRQVGGMVLANEIASRPLELINGDLDNEIFQYFIISDPDFLLEHTDEVVFHDEAVCMNTSTFAVVVHGDVTHRVGIELLAQLVAMLTCHLLVRLVSSLQLVRREGDAHLERLITRCRVPLVHLLGIYRHVISGHVTDLVGSPRRAFDFVHLLLFAIAKFGVNHARLGICSNS